MVMKAKVFSIGAIAAGGWRQSPYIRTIPLKVAIDGSDPRLIPDLSGSADVVLDQVEGALIVPRQAIYRQDGKAFVDVKTADGFAAREVTVGLGNDTHAAILSGLQEGQQIRLSH
jgi:multidrug efflux pump subunit AcrA (membrane-fusion protein)